MTIPAMTPVESTNIHSVGYSPEARHLYIKFKSGNTYRYEDVAPHAHENLIKSDSVGKHFSQNILGKYAHQKVSHAG